MLCQECHHREATLHVKKIIDGVKEEAYLCEICAAKKNPYHSQSPGQQVFNLNQLLSGMMELEGQSPGIPLQSKRLQCPNCGMTYEKFKSISRFGCVECYSTFKDKINPLFRKIHGNLEHRGKIPKRSGEVLERNQKIQQLKSRMQRAIEQEAFEEAAKIRDEIKNLEKEE